MFREVQLIDFFPNILAEVRYGLVCHFLRVLCKCTVGIVGAEGVPCALSEYEIEGFLHVW